MDKQEYKQEIKELYEELFLADLPKRTREKILKDKKWDRELEKEYYRDEKFYDQLRPMLKI
jgi:hypothetical protein